MTIEEIGNNVPDRTATHYLIVMFFGLIYLKYIDGYSYWFDKQKNEWVKTSFYTQSKPISDTSESKDVN